jgi:hypothetical protein
MVFLLLLATRVHRRRWAFWQRRTADVFVWLPVDTVANAKKKAGEDMARRGWRIDRFEVSRMVDEAFPRADPTVRVNIWRASKGIPTYNFYAPHRRSKAATTNGAVTISSRYMDSPGVTINQARVPERLRPLLQFANEWAIGDDVERSDFIAGAPYNQKKAFVEAVTPLFDDIDTYARLNERAVPVPDEVIVLNLLAEAADVASHDVDD